MPLDADGDEIAPDTGPETGALVAALDDVLAGDAEAIRLLHKAAEALLRQRGVSVGLGGGGHGNLDPWIFYVHNGQVVWVTGVYGAWFVGWTHDGDDWVPTTGFAQELVADEGAPPGIPIALERPV